MKKQMFDYPIRILEREAANADRIAEMGYLQKHVRKTEEKRARVLRQAAKVLMSFQILEREGIKPRRSDADLDKIKETIRRA